MPSKAVLEEQARNRRDRRRCFFAAAGELFNKDRHMKCILGVWVPAKTLLNAGLGERTFSSTAFGHMFASATGRLDGCDAGRDVVQLYEYKKAKGAPAGGTSSDACVMVSGGGKLPVAINLYKGTAKNGCKAYCWMLGDKRPPCLELFSAAQLPERRADGLMDDRTLGGKLHKFAVTIVKALVPPLASAVSGNTPTVTPVKRTTFFDTVQRMIDDKTIPVELEEWCALLGRLTSVSPDDPPEYNLKREKLLKAACEVHDECVDKLRGDYNKLHAVVAALSDGKLSRALKKLPSAGRRSTVDALRASTGTRVERDLGRGMAEARTLFYFANAFTCCCVCVVVF